MTIRAILWDFGDTLCDQTWMRAPLANEPAWPVAYLTALASDGLVERWDTGRATATEVADKVARGLGQDPARILAHMRACCRNISFYSQVMELALASPLPRAIVTVNCDLFTDVVAPAYDLEHKFDAIVTSWQEGVTDKAALCEVARRRLDPGLAPGQCLLVDNLAENVEAWRARGGSGIVFTGAESLIRDWPALSATMDLESPGCAAVSLGHAGEDI